MLLTWEELCLACKSYSNSPVPFQTSETSIDYSMPADTHAHGALCLMQLVHHVWPRADLEEPGLASPGLAQHAHQGPGGPRGRG